MNKIDKLDIFKFTWGLDRDFSIRVIIIIIIEEVHWVVDIVIT